MRSNAEIGQMSLFDMAPECCVREWEYDEDNGTVLCRCPDCGGRMIIHRYAYWNPYRYCPYCGIRLNEGKITNKRCQVYRTDRKTEMEGRLAYGKE